MNTDSKTIDVVKRAGKRSSESFNEQKLYASVLAACLSVRSPHGVAESAARSVAANVISWCKQRPEITSNDIRRVASQHLEQIHPEAAYLYKHHRLVL
jgi:transcriptional regulator NrdR family protein